VDSRSGESEEGSLGADPCPAVVVPAKREAWLSLLDEAERQESGVQRRKRLRTLPSRAEDEIMRMRYLTLRDKVSPHKPEVEARGGVRRARRKKRCRKDEYDEFAAEQLYAEGKRRRSKGDVWFTTLAEVAWEQRGEDEASESICGSTDCGSADVRWDDVTEGLFSDCLRDLGEESEKRETDR